MNLKDLVSRTEKPKLYEPGSAFMWTDDHISKQLLDVHLNPDVDLASRKIASIKKTAEWILDTQDGKGKLNILDLGCGPGLYSEFFAQKGHNVTGVDISENSIAYAKQSAQEKGLDITYIHESYLNLALHANEFDVVVLIFTDLGVLTPTDRDTLLKTIHNVLKKGGTFIFDVLKDTDLDKKMSPKTWKANQSGFWRDSPHLVLSESFLYPQEKVILFQHNVLDSQDTLEIYRFWTHFFSESDVSNMLEAHHFVDIRHRDDILPEGDMWNGENVIFTMASK